MCVCVCVCVQIYFFLIKSPYSSSIPRFKQRVEYLSVDYGNLYDILDAVKVADSLLLLLSTDNGVDEFGDYCLSCLLGQGLPAVTLALQVSG